MKNKIKKIIFILKKNSLSELIQLIILTLFNSIFEIIGIGLIIPIMSILANKDIPNFLFIFFPNNISKEEMLFFVFLIFILIYMFKFLLSILVIIKKNKYSFKLFIGVADFLFLKNLRNKFILGTKTHSSEKIRTIQGESNLFSFGVILPLMELIIDSTLFLFICFFLIYYNYQVSIVLILFFLSTGLIWYLYFKNKLKYYGKLRHDHSAGAIKQIQDSFGSIKEVIIYNLEKIFLNKFTFHNREYGESAVKRATITSLPRIILEFLSIFAIFIIVIYLININYTLDNILVLLSVYIFATLRMLPSILKIINSIQSINYNNVVIDVIYKEFEDYYGKIEINNRPDKNIKNFSFEKLEIENLSFVYHEKNKKVFSDVNLNIYNKDKIGIIGTSGNGKTTLINLICGLIHAEKGQIKINNLDINKLLYSWQNKIGLVSQNSQVFDESILFNITFRENIENLNINEINDVLKNVQLFDYVNSLPNKLFSKVGERGSQLSGGQAQRLLLARALYRKPELLILDEPASAIDIDTEVRIFEPIFSHNVNKTIICVTHREKVLKYCNRVIEIKNNKIIEVK